MIFFCFKFIFLFLVINRSRVHASRTQTRYVAVACMRYILVQMHQHEPRAELSRTCSTDGEPVAVCLTIGLRPR